MNNLDLAQTIDIDIASSKMAVWTAKLLQDKLLMTLVRRDSGLFAAAYAAMSPYFDDKEQGDDGAVSISTETRDEIRKVSKEFERTFGSMSMAYDLGYTLFNGYKLYEDSYHKGNWDRWEQLLAQAATKAESDYGNLRTSLEHNVDTIGAVLELSELDTKLLEFQLLRTHPMFDAFYRKLFGTANKYMIHYSFSTMFDGEKIDYNSTLFKAGIINYNEVTGNILPISTELAKIFFDGYEKNEDIFNRFVVKTQKKSSTTSAIGTLVELDKEILLKLFNTRTPEDRGINVLLYGSKSLDKKTAVFDILTSNGYEVYSLVTKGVSSTDMPARAYIAQAFLQHREDADFTRDILIIEDASSVLQRAPRNIMSFIFGLVDNDSENKNDLDSVDEHLMDQNPITTVWIADRPEHILEENVGRFLYHCEIKPASRADRKVQISSVIDKLDLSPELQTHLSKYHQINPRQISSAAKLATMIGENTEDKEHILKKSIHASQRALKREQMEDLRESVTKYSLENLNVKGKFGPQQIIEALKKRPIGALCFYGLPGTGKTLLAEYIAMQLDKPIIMKRASDLLDKYVGGNEQNIAGMFAEAVEEDAILFLDEADSFMRDRSMARAEWNISMVNQMLQEIERHKGIFICATNLFSQIDAAALRRFTFKLEFLPMTEEQRWTMFQTEADLANKGLDDVELFRLQNKLSKIQNLTPGDFATVKRQAVILGEEITPDDWIVQLEIEAETKMEGIERNKLGFNIPGKN